MWTKEKEKIKLTQFEHCIRTFGEYSFIELKCF